MKTAGKFLMALFVCGVLTFSFAPDKVEAAETSGLQIETTGIVSTDDTQLLYGPPRRPHYGPPPPPHRRPHYGPPHHHRPGPPPPPPRHRRW